MLLALLLQRFMCNNASCDDFAERARIITGLYLYPIISIIGIVGNILCIVVLNQKDMRSSTNIYLTALAVSDLLKMLNDFMYFPAMILHGQTDVLYINYYSIGYFISQFSAMGAAWLTVIVATERFFMVVHPGQRDKCFRPSVSTAMVHSMLTFFCILVLMSPCALRYRSVCTNLARNVSVTCLQPPSNTTIREVITTPLWQNEEFSTSYTIIQYSFRSFLPLLILIVLNLRIIVALQKTRANRRLGVRNRITVMLCIVIFCFIILATPDAVISILGWGYHEEKDGGRLGIREITDLLLATNSSINVFLYVAFNRKFRTHLKQLFTCSVGGQARSPPRSHFTVSIHKVQSGSSKPNDNRLEDGAQLPMKVSSACYDRKRSAAAFEI